MKLLVLYEELATYFIACVGHLAKQHDVEVHIIRKGINKEAPFEFDIPSSIKLYDRDKFTEEELISLADSIVPNAVLCGGWSYPPYLSICKKYNKSIPVILGFDNWWTASAKQIAGSLFAGSFFKKHFKFAFVPGEPQKKFANKMGFKESAILTGAYSCDQNYFQEIYKENKEDKEKNFPHRFIFVGRYYEFKGVKELWQAFIELKTETKNDWELWCLGKGDIDAIVHPDIKHFGFIQPKEMDRFLKNTGVCIMPSKVEPWGVALHEFASAGFPLIASDQVGAGERFLKENENGLTFHSGNINELKAAMKKMITFSDQELVKMGDKSNVLSKNITPATWADSVLKMMNAK